ncbi:hypothetical protein HZB02_04155 [Candidatus Woesearchaeota archaeon]|nr:hypothetical protein [Candidatus Woesearchaeota archaeon]
MAVATLSSQAFRKCLAEARQDPAFQKDIRQFIKVASGSYKLKDFGLDA